MMIGDEKVKYTQEISYTQLYTYDYGGSNVVHGVVRGVTGV